MVWPTHGGDRGFRGRAGGWRRSRPVRGLDPYRTTTVPVIPLRWMPQLYWYVPTVLNSME